MAAPADEAARPGHMLATIGALYFTQGLPMGLAFMALPAIFRKLGYSTEAIGMMGVVILPWALKFLWAPSIDRFEVGSLGRRRGWIICAQIALALLYVLTGVLGSMELSALTIVGLLLLANTVSATQDIATDGWAVEALRGPHLAWANGLQIGAFSFGMLVGGAATVAVFDWGGWMPAFGLLAALAILSVVPVLLSPERRSESVAPDRKRKPSLLATIRRPGAVFIMSVAALFHFAPAMVGAMLGPFLVDAGLSLADVGMITGTGIAVIAVFGGGLGGLLARRFPVERVAVGSGLAAALGLGLWGVAAAYATLSTGLAMAIIATVGFAGGIAYVGFFTIFMRWSSLQQAGTDFTLLQCTESCTNIVAAIAAGQLASLLGYGGLFAVAVVIGVLAMGWNAFALSQIAGRRSDTADLHPVPGPVGAGS
jgi:MFS transporter, PAT family, beta-lactamase induction signal transducer AmpG